MDTVCRNVDLLGLYPPSERSQTGGYTVFTCLSVCVSVFTQSSLNSVCVPPTRSKKFTWRIYVLSERLLVPVCNSNHKVW